MSDLPEHVRKNRAKWDELTKQYPAAGERGWKRDTPVWGIWHVPEANCICAAFVVAVLATVLATCCFMTRVLPQIRG